MSVNFSDTTPAAPAGSTNVKHQTDGSGNVSAYVPTSVVELTANNYNATAQVANIAATNLVAIPVTGRYKVSAYIIVTTAATTSSTMPSITVTWSDADSGQAQTLTLTATSTGNTLTTFAQASALLSVNAAAPLAFSTSGYASVGATAMQYAIHIVVEQVM